MGAGGEIRIGEGVANDRRDGRLVCLVPLAQRRLTSDREVPHMATRAYSVTRMTAYGDPCHVIQWTGLLNGDDGQPVEMPGSADRSVHALGTFGAAGNVRIEG